MAIKYNQNQVPDKSILDLHGRQAYMGNEFTAIPAALTIGTAELPAVLLRMPASTTNPASAFLTALHAIVDSSSATCLIKMYLQPTVSNVGADQVSTNVRPASGVAATAVVTTLPTVSNNGILIYTSRIGANQTLNDHALHRVLDAGYSVLITLQASGASTAVHVNIAWFET